MSATLISNNTTLKVSGGGSGASGGLSFSTASDECAFLSVQHNAGSFTVGSATYGNSGVSNTSVIYVGASTGVAYSAGTLNASWVIFKNNP